MRYGAEKRFYVVGVALVFRVRPGHAVAWTGQGRCGAAYLCSGWMRSGEPGDRIGSHFVCMLWAGFWLQERHRPKEFAQILASHASAAGLDANSRPSRITLNQGKAKNQGEDRPVGAGASCCAGVWPPNYNNLSSHTLPPAPSGLFQPVGDETEGSNNPLFINNACLRVLVMTKDDR